MVWSGNKDVLPLADLVRKGDSVFYRCTQRPQNDSAVFAVDLRTRTGGWVK